LGAVTGRKRAGNGSGGAHRSTIMPASGSIIERRPARAPYRYGFSGGYRSAG
jgi:hypothetical protein